MSKDAKPDAWMPSVRPGATLRIEFDLAKFVVRATRLTTADVGHLHGMLMAEASGSPVPDAPNHRVQAVFDRRGEFTRTKGGLARSRLSLAIRKFIYGRDGGRCTYCGQNIAWADYHCDHVEPASRGGSDSNENLVAACRSCNLSKAAKPLEVWRP